MKKISFIIILLAISLLACRKANIDESLNTSGNTEYPDWTETTHSNLVPPDYTTVFPQDKVLRFDITISNEDWIEMQDDLESNLSSGTVPGGVAGGGPGGGDPAASSDYTPIWKPCSFFFEGKEWYQVGIRFKGNSSLQSTYEMGIGKLSLKLDFDQFEDDYPALQNQRFYGFRQLNLNNNYDDQSLMREKIGADVFRSYGLASSKTAFCVVYVDFGEGPVYFGLYALVEEVDDTVVESQFNDDSGNLYKPDGNAATFAAGSFDTGQMELKTNQDFADYSDVESLYNKLNSSLRTSDPEQWKSNLESVFNVDVFLKWLAANIAIQNWDTYGIMPHNYYLYHNPDDDKLTWIPWDNNEAFQEGKMGGALSLYLDEVGNDWPLIRYIMDVDEYRNQYKLNLQQFIDEVFTPEAMTATYDKYYNLLKDYAYAETYNYSFLNSTAEFDQAYEALKLHVEQRNQAIQAYIDSK